MFVDDSNDPTLTVIVKYCKQSSILAIKLKYKKRKPYFSQVTLEEVFKEINKLDGSKAAQKTSIPTNILKEIQIYLIQVLTI